MFQVGDCVYYEEWGEYTDIEGVVRDLSTSESLVGIEVTNYPEFRNHNLNNQISNYKGLYLKKGKTTLLDRIIPYTQFQTGDTDDDI